MYLVPFKFLDCFKVLLHVIKTKCKNNTCACMAVPVRCFFVTTLQGLRFYPQTQFGTIMYRLVNSTTGRYMYCINIFSIIAQVIIEKRVHWLVEDYVISCYNHSALGDYNTEALIFKMVTVQILMFLEKRKRKCICSDSHLNNYAN